MRAAVFREYGAPEVLTVTHIDAPVPTASQVLVKVRYAGVNFAEVMFRRGQIPVGLPHVPGLEVAGEVVQVGSDVTGLEVGDLVVALTLAGGGYAELAVAEAAHTVALKGPLASLSPSVAAAAVCNVTTAWGAFHLAGSPQAGERVLVLAAAGGVGSALGQLAVAAGAYVVGAVGSDTKRDALPATVFAERITYDEVLRSDESFDVVFDAVGGPVRTSLLGRTNMGGRYVVYGNASRDAGSRDLDAVWFSGAAVVGYNLGGLAHARPDLLGEHMRQALAAVADGTVGIGTELVGLDAVVDAHRALEERVTTGKIVIDVLDV